MDIKRFMVIRYDATPGKVFDWVHLTDHMIENEDGSVSYEHLNAKTIYLGENDSIDNYEEVDEVI